MKILDEIQLNNKKYTCTQILYLKNVMVYRMTENDSNKDIWVSGEEGKYNPIEDDKILKQIEDLIEIENTDIIINKVY